MKMQYHLLPFDFTRIAGKEILVNEVGDMMVVPEGTTQRIVDRQMERNDLYKSLVANLFISEDLVPPPTGCLCRSIERKETVYGLRMK